MPGIVNGQNITRICGGSYFLPAGAAPVSPQKIAESGRDQHIHDGGEHEAEREDRLYPGQAPNRDTSRAHSLGSEAQIRRSFSNGSWNKYLRQRLQNPARSTDLQLNSGN